MKLRNFLSNPFNRKYPLYPLKYHDTPSGQKMWRLKLIVKLNCMLSVRTLYSYWSHSPIYNLKSAWMDEPACTNVENIENPVGNIMSKNKD